MLITAAPDLRSLREIRCPTTLQADADPVLITEIAAVSASSEQPLRLFGALGVDVDKELRHVLHDRYEQCVGVLVHLMKFVLQFSLRVQYHVSCIILDKLAVHPFVLDVGVGVVRHLVLDFGVEDLLEVAIVLLFGLGVDLGLLDQHVERFERLLLVLHQLT